MTAPLSLAAPRLFSFRSLLGTCGRVTTGDGLQPSLEGLLILIRANLTRRFHEALPLRLGAFFRCPCHDNASRPRGLRSVR